MNKNYNFRDIFLDKYYSPFPRNKSNKEVFKYSQAKKLPDNKTIIDIPPSVTLSYMKKNPLYFDTKKYSNRLSQSRPKTSSYRTPRNKVIKSQRNFNSNKRNIINNCTVFDNKKLEKILSSSNNKVISERKTLKKRI